MKQRVAIPMNRASAAAISPMPQASWTEARSLEDRAMMLPGRVLQEKTAVEQQQAGKELLAQVPFEQAGKAEHQITPAKAECSNAAGQGHQVETEPGQGQTVDRPLGKAVKGPLGDAGHEQLQNIDKHQADEAQQQAFFIEAQIGPHQMKGGGCPPEMFAHLKPD